MPILLKIRMLSGEDENFIRDYEVLYDMNLLDLHNFICDDLRYDNGNMSSFFMSNEEWEKQREFTLMDMGMNDSDEAPIAMENIKMGHVLKHNHDRLLYVFDPFGDRSMFLELMGARKADGSSGFPKVVFAHGDAPDQFDVSEVQESKSIFDEAMDDYSDFDGDDDFDDDIFFR